MSTTPMARHWQRKTRNACTVMWHLRWYMSYRNIVKYIDTSLVKSVLQVFVSDVILIEHKICDHPKGPSHPPQTTPKGPVPSTSGVTGPQAEQAPIICVPDPDPFEEKLDTRIGLVNPDRNHQVKCGECDRFLKSKKIRKLHVMCYHPMAAYQCPFDPNIIFYTKDDLVLHCKQNHVLCKLCDTMSVNQASLEEHYRRRHPKSLPPKVQPAATSSPDPADKPESEQVEPSQEDQAKTQLQPQPDQPTPAIFWQMFALFMAQPASILVTYARNHLAQWQILGCTLMYTTRCHVSFVTGSSSMSAAWTNTYRKSTRSASYHNTIASWKAALSSLEHRLRVSDT